MRMRHIIHVIISILMWILFGYYWYVVGGREIGEETQLALILLIVVIVVGLIGTLWWVAHNKRLASRNRRAGAPSTKPEPFERDNLDRPIEGPDVNVLRGAKVVDITVRLSDDEDPYGGTKIYAAASPGGRA